MKKNEFRCAICQEVSKRGRYVTPNVRTWYHSVKVCMKTHCYKAAKAGDK